MKFTPLHASLLLLLSPWTQADEPVFQLGEVRVSGSQANTRLDPMGTQVKAQDLERFNRDSVSQAISLLPWVSFTTNMRNEQPISVRGFDGRRTPLFLDGVPVYVPYDGQVDFSRFLTFDLAEIEVAKGFSSVTYGPNNMGGAINLVTRKPRQPYETNALVGYGSGNERKLAANIGGNQGNWYFQAGVSWVDTDTFPLSRSFLPTNLEDGGDRNNADRRDQKASLKIGLTPDGGSEYAIGLSSQRAEKGQPPNTNPQANPLNFWRWPNYDKDSLYFIANQRLSATEDLKLRLYKDQYTYEQNCYANATYTTTRNCQGATPAAPRFLLDDAVEGGSLTLESRRLDRQVLRVALHHKTDEHQERTTGPVTTYRDQTQSFGLEDSIRLGERLDLALGLSHDRQHALTSGNYGSPRDQSQTNPQAGLFYWFEDNSQLYGTLARKGRFPSLKERFSQQVGTQGGPLTGVANPDLQAERALHHEIGTRLRDSDWSLDGALFYARIQNSIQSVTFVSGGKTFGQLQNMGEATSKGLELSLNKRYGPGLSTGFNYTYLLRRNVDNPALPATDTPRNKLFAFVDWVFAPAWRLITSLDAENGRVVASAPDKAQYLTLAGFGSLAAKLVFQFTPGASLELGGRNLGDRNIELMDGFPLPGRTWFTNLRVQL